MLKEKVDFKDKIVMIGATAKGIKDVFTTPNGIDYGVYVHANAVNTVLEKTFFNYFNIPLEKILIFLLIVLSVYFNLSRSSYILILSNIAIAVIFLIIFPLLIATFTISLLNYPAEIILGLIFSLAISNIAKYMLENRSKIKLNTALSEYVSKDIAEEILSGEGNVNLNGEKKKIGIFFSDIAGFTTISEKFSPEQLVEFLREYLGEMSNIIMDQRGFINKYEGDAIMGLWGVFGHETTSSFDCCMAALKQQERLRELNSLWKEKYKEELRVRMGMHVGEAIIGNIGAKGRKMEFTALGDSVNLGSRLEGVNKFYGTYLCVSESIYEEVKEQFEFRYLDKIRVKGKEIPVNIYELLSVKDGLDVRKADIMEKFATALEFYFLRKFEDARTILEPLVVLGDAPSRVFLERCKMYAAQSPTDDWDGVWTMEEK
ncbi:MAG: CHASE2 domain-containing protein [Candidatus Peribacteria bacterium]|nr:MAG: CHASE2 domain-containing protein [Candidatus Peribacteria bacterium]